MTESKVSIPNNSKELSNDSKKDSQMMMMASTQKSIKEKKISDMMDVIDIVTNGNFMQHLIHLKEDPKSIQYVSLEDASKQDGFEDEDILDVDDMDYSQRIKIMRKGARIFYSKQQLDSTLQMINAINGHEHFLEKISKNKKELDVNIMEWREAKKELRDILSN